MRTVLRTIPAWKFWIPQFEFSAKECLPLSQGFSGVLSPAHWDCLSIAANLRDAARGFLSHPNWAIGGRSLIQQLPADLNRVPIQRVTYKILMANRFGSNLFETLTRRLCDLLHPYFLDFQNSISLEVCCRCLKEMRVSDSIEVL